MRKSDTFFDISTSGKIILKDLLETVDVALASIELPVGLVLIGNGRGEG
ncbi:MAG: hypothetical protein H7Y04_11405 [Verrucomicrobia bacterium]|nr:hypothetical protein [Cytophagales bacterium]